jgi:hypothetical protein
MNTLMEIEEEKETELESAKIGDGFYNIIGGQRLAAVRKLRPWCGIWTRRPGSFLQDSDNRAQIVD